MVVHSIAVLHAVLYCSIIRARLLEDAAFAQDKSEFRNIR